MLRKKSLVFLLVFFGFICLPILAANRVINVPMFYQEHSMWCWDANSQMIIYYYKGWAPSQCAIANWAWGRSDCCASSYFYWNHPCNRGNLIFGSTGIQGILRNWGVGSYGYYSPVSQSVIVREINYGRPFVIGVYWTSGGGHVMVGRGYWYDAYYVYYNDPWPGEGPTWATYSWLVRSWDHVWDSTLLTY